MSDHSHIKLGKRPRRRDARTLKLARYLTTALPVAPASVDYTRGITDFGMMLNDQLGCCVLGDTLVNTADATLGYRSPYSGPIITIKCLSGKKLAVTPNHAILTPRGFTPAKLIKKGDYLVGTSRAEIFPRSSRCGSQTDLNQAPSPIEKICSSLDSAVNAVTKIVPRSVHFHGDGQFIDGDINVIGTNGFLRSKLHEALRKPKCQYKIGSARKLKRGLERLSSPLLRVLAGGLAPLGDMCLRNQRLNFMSRHARISKAYGLPQRSRLMTVFPEYRLEASPADACSGEDRLHRFPFDIARNQLADVAYFPSAMQVSRLAPTANRYPSFVESPLDSLCGDPDLFGDLHDRNPGLISQDRVIHIEINELSTHVYDLSTRCGYYVSNGIVTHNCTIAAVGHAVQVWTVNALGRELTVPDVAILNYYQKWDGYNPADPTTDQGGVELDVLNNWRQQGFDGESLDAFVAISLGNSGGPAKGAVGTATDRVIGKSGDRVSSEKSGAPGIRISGANDAASLPAEQRPAGHPITGSADQQSLRLPDRATTGWNEPAIPDSGFPIPQSGLSIPESGFAIPDAGCPNRKCASLLPEIATAIWLFGGAYIGVELPISAQNQDVWDVTDGPDAEPGSWGGHAVYVVGYDLNVGTRDTGNGTRATAAMGAPSLIPDDPRPALNHDVSSTGPSPAPQVLNSDSFARSAGGPFPNAESRVTVSGISASRAQSPAPSTHSPTLTCITWGQPKKMTWAFFAKYCSEAYALVSRAWIETSGLAPSGCDLATLEKDLKLVTA